MFSYVNGIFRTSSETCIILDSIANYPFMLT